MLITSSESGSLPNSGSSTYSSVKAFKTHLARCLNYELKQQVDVMAYCPSGVTTKMSKVQRQTFRVIGKRRAADVAFRDLGCMDYSYGAFRHEFFNWRNVNWPLHLVQKEKMRMSWIIHERIQQRKLERC